MKKMVWLAVLPLLLSAAESPGRTPEPNRTPEALPLYPKGAPESNGLEDAAVDKEALSGSQAERLPASAEQDFTLRHQGNLDLWVPVADIPVAGTGHLLTIHGEGKVPGPMLSQLPAGVVHQDGSAFQGAGLLSKMNRRGSVSLVKGPLCPQDNAHTTWNR